MAFDYGNSQTMNYKPTTIKRYRPDEPDEPRKGETAGRLARDFLDRMNAASGRDQAGLRGDQYGPLLRGDLTGAERLHDRRLSQAANAAALAAIQNQRGNIGSREDYYRRMADGIEGFRYGFNNPVLMKTAGASQAGNRYQAAYDYRRNMLNTAASDPRSRGLNRNITLDRMNQMRNRSAVGDPNSQGLWHLNRGQKAYADRMSGLAADYLAYLNGLPPDSGGGVSGGYGYYGGWGGGGGGGWGGGTYAPEKQVYWNDLMNWNVNKPGA